MHLWRLKTGWSHKKDKHHQCGANAAATQQLVIEIRLRVKESQFVLRAYQMTLVKSVQISKCCDYYACNHQWAECQRYYLLDGDFAGMKNKLSLGYCVKQKEKPAAVWSCRISIYLMAFSFAEVTSSQPGLTCLFEVKGWKEHGWKEKHAITVYRGVLVKKNNYNKSPAQRHEGAVRA